MKKQGFTLAELLIVLGITGVVAAVLLPVINNLLPDKTKMMYLKAYDELMQDVKSLGANSSLFPYAVDINGKSYDVSNYPFINNEIPINKKFSKDEYTGKTKLCNLIAFTMNAEPNCKEDAPDYSDSLFDANKSYTTKNGMQWWIVPKVYETSEGKASYQTDIYVDVDPSKKSKNCLFNSLTCKQPDRFKFLLAADGTLIPADPMGLKYIQTRKNLLKQKYTVEGDVLAKLDDTLLDNNLKEVFDNNNSDKEPDKEPEPDEPEIVVPENQKVCSESYKTCVCGDIFEGRIINCFTMTDFRSSISDWPGRDVVMSQISKRIINFQFPLNSNAYVYSLHQIYYPYSGNHPENHKFVYNGIYKLNQGSKTYYLPLPDDILQKTLTEQENRAMNDRKSIWRQELYFYLPNDAKYHYLCFYDNIPQGPVTEAPGFCGVNDSAHSQLWYPDFYSRSSAYTLENLSNYAANKSGGYTYYSVDNVNGYN